MEKQEYQTLYDLEDSYWWYVGLRDLVLYFINKFHEDKGEIKILDAGCGTGYLLDKLKDYSPWGVDMSPEALNFCRLRNLDRVTQASISNLPFKNNSFNLITSLDVLYHAGVKDDLEALKELYRVLSKNGVLMLNLVAYNFLKSKHDIAVHTKRRYTVKGLREKAQAAGFMVEKMTYRNTILFPLAFSKRMFDKLLSDKKHKPSSDLVRLPYFLNKFFTQVLFWENVLLRRINFPFGLSVFAVLRKP